MFFKPKKDTFYTFGIWGSSFFGLIVIVDTSFSSSFLSAFYWIALIIIPVICGWLIWVWFSLKYRVEDNILTIEARPFKQKIEIKDIKKIMREKSILSSGALSIDRLQIQYGKYKFVSISPEKEYEFIILLLSKNPQIQIDESISLTL